MPESRIEAQSVKVALIITNREFARSGGNPPRMELGKTWGPFTFEFLITDVEIGLGPGEAIDASLMITVDVVEYWYPPIGNPMAYPITFSNKQQTPTKLVNPAEEPTLSFRRRHGMRPVEEARESGHSRESLL